LSGEVSASVLATQARSSEARLSAAADSLASVMGVHSLAAYTGSGDAPLATARPTRTAAPTQAISSVPSTSSLTPATADSDGNVDPLLCTDVPADVPVMQVDTTFTYCDRTTLSFQTNAASYDEVLDYYRTGLSANGWAEDPQSGPAVVTSDAAVLYNVKSGQHIIVTISASSSDGSTALQVILSP